MPSKKANQLMHAKRRLLERHRIVLTRPLRQRILNDIRGGAAEFLGRQSRRVTAWEVEIEGRKVKVLYDSVRHGLITFLPAGAEWEPKVEEAA